MTNRFFEALAVVPALPMIFAGPLIVYLVAITWHGYSRVRQVSTAIVVAVLSIWSAIAVFGLSEYGWMRLFMLVGVWSINVPILLLIWLVRRSDRDVEAAAEEIAKQRAKQRGKRDFGRPDDT